MADYVLPGTTYLERYDLNSHWVTWPVLGLRQPVVKPLFGQPAEYELVAALGRRLGLKTKDGKDFFRVGPVSGEPVEDHLLPLPGQHSALSHEITRYCVIGSIPSHDIT